MSDVDKEIMIIREKIKDVKKRWPFHSAKTSLYQELEDLESELEELKKKANCLRGNDSSAFARERKKTVQMWLLKTEPKEYSFQDLWREKNTVWDGVKAPLAQKNVKLMHGGDKVFIYHSGKEKAIVGTATVTCEPYPDPEREDEKLMVVDIEAGKPFIQPVTLKQVKDSGLFPDWELIRLPRLSVLPVSHEQWDKICRWSKP